MAFFETLTRSFSQLSQLSKAAPIAEKADETFRALLKKHKITDDEYKTLRNIMGRAPTMTELGIFSAMWSEHCSYKSSRVHLKRLPTEGPDVVVGPGENAGVVRLSGKLCVAFKMESHNHPSYIEPYQGAATGVGGILRDVFCMGARPVANLNSLRFGRKDHSRTPYLFDFVTKGIGDYGNCVGIPTVAGTVSFDPCYDGNCLVNAMTVGVIHEDRIFKGYATGQGNYLVYVGSATGRDGIHGASMASDSFASKDESERSTVQVGDPFTEKLLLEATLEALEKNLVIGLQDMGAAGLTSSSFEMADRAGNGLFMDLDRVPIRAKNMSAYELMLSESQERMLMCCEPQQWPALQAVLEKWQLSHAVVGFVTDTGRVQIIHKGQLEVDVPVAPLTEQAPRYQRPMDFDVYTRVPEDQHAAACRAAIRQQGFGKVLVAILNDTGAKDKVYTQYDHHIGTKTVKGPKEQGAALLWMRSDWADPKDEHLGLAVATACNERYCAVDARLGAAHAVTKAARAIAALGAKPIGATDCLNYGNPQNPKVMAEFSLGVDGISDACQALAIPVVSGNVSLYNETDGTSIYPTPMIGLVGRHPDVRLAPSAIAAQTGAIYWLRPKNLRLTYGGSNVAKQLGLATRAGDIPALEWELERQAMALLQDWVARSYLLASRDVGEGGIAGAVAKMVLPRGWGFQGELKANLGQKELEDLLFGEAAPMYLLQFRRTEDAQLAAKASEAVGLSLSQLGTVVSDSSGIQFGPSHSLGDDAYRAYAEALIL